MRTKPKKESSHIMSRAFLKNNEQELLNKLSELVAYSQNKIATQANRTLTLLFWQIGKHLNDFVLDHKRAEYGTQIMSTVSTHLSEHYGNNVELRNLRRMSQFSERFLR
tara:strand:- start:262 stop:588 length:327 start_codon:yes stop_codon:yes gene_type:complete